MTDTYLVGSGQSSHTQRTGHVSADVVNIGAQTYIHGAFEAPKNGRNAGGRSELSKDTVFSNDGVQELLVKPEKLETEAHVEHILVGVWEHRITSLRASAIGHASAL
jgi:hypothetical protein